MGEKKNIDRLFQESFKNFEATPDAAVWEGIADKLGHKEKKRRLIPYWVQLGGIAAALLLLLTIGYNFFNSGENNDTPQVVQEETLDQPGTDNSNIIIHDIKDLPVDTKETVGNSIDETELSDINTGAEQEKDAITNTVSGTSDNSVAIVDNGIDENDSSAPDVNSNAITAIKKDAAASNPISIVDEGVAMVQKEEAIDKEQDKLSINNTIVADASNNAKKEVSGIDKTEIVVEEGKSENTIAQNNGKKKSVETEDANKISLEDAIAQQKEIEEEDVAEVTEDKAKRWSLNPMVAPVYYNSIGDGSPINPEFIDNSKSGSINLSYGFNLAYQLGSRLTVRSGVNKVNLGYETEDITFSASLNGGDLQTIDYSKNATNILINDQPVVSTVSQQNDFSEIASSASRIAEVPGVINQQLGYLEVPVELKYRLVDKKLGVNLIGGLSTLFLTDNAITLESDNLITEIGEANNINDLSFSTNLGVGIDYKVNNSLQLNLEPMFKYQFNAFSRDAGDFKPYYLGVYTGFSFKF